MNAAEKFARRTLTSEEIARIEREGLSAEEMRGAIYALLLVEGMAKAAKPQFPALSETDVQIPIDKVLISQADLTIGLANSARLSLPAADIPMADCPVFVRRHQA